MQAQSQVLGNQNGGRMDSLLKGVYRLDDKNKYKHNELLLLLLKSTQKWKLSIVLGKKRMGV